jgi:predicted nucleic acid-binding protein
VIVVTDTSSVLNLCCLRHELLLQKLFGEVLAPRSVVEEFRRLAGSDPRFAGLAFPDFIEISAPSQIPISLAGNQRLHAGEVDALALAAEIKAAAVLMDERAGRAEAKALGIPVIGILGVLIRAKALGQVPELAPLLDRLQFQAGFWIAPSLRARVLKLAGE